MTSEQQITPWTFYGQLKQKLPKHSKIQSITDKPSLNLSHSTPNKPIKSTPQINSLLKDHAEFLDQINLLSMLKIIREQLQKQNSIEHQEQKEKSPILQLPKLPQIPQRSGSLPGAKLHIKTRPLKSYLISPTFLKQDQKQFYGYSPKLSIKKTVKNNVNQSIQTQPNKQFNDYSIIQIMQKIQKNNQQKIQKITQNKAKMFWYGKRQKINQLMFYLPQ